MTFQIHLVNRNPPLESGVQSFDTSYIALVLPTTVYLEIELELVQVKDKVAPNK